MGILANGSLHKMEVGRAQSRPSIKCTMEVGTILFFIRSPRLKGDMSHGAMNCNVDGWLRACASKDDDVLMECDVTNMIARCAHHSGTSDGGSNAATVGGNHRTGMMLLKENRVTLGRNIIPVEHVDVLVLGPLGMFMLVPKLE